MQNNIASSKQNPFSSFVFLFLSVLLFLSSMNFMNRYFYFIFIAFILFFFFNNKSISITPTFFLLLSLSILFIIFDTEVVKTTNDVIRQFIYPLSYILGLNCIKPKTYGIENSKNNTEKLFFIFCVITSLGLLIHIILNLYMNWDSTDRNVIDYWVKVESSATCNAALFCFGIGCLPAFFLNKTDKLLKIFSIVSLCVFVLFSLLLAGRTFFILFSITFICVFIYFIFSIEKKSKALKVFLIVSLIILLLVILYQNNVFNLKTVFEESNFYDRFFGDNSDVELDEDGRLKKKALYFTLMDDYFWGGGKLRQAAKTAYAHELYLDTYSRAGFIPYIMMVIFVFGRTFNALKLIKSKKLSLFTNCLIMGLFISINIEFLIEPIVEGVPWLLPTFCILCGMVDYMASCKFDEVSLQSD